MEGWKIVICMLVNYITIGVIVGVWADHVHNKLFELKGEIRRLDKKLDQLMNKNYDEEI